MGLVGLEPTRLLRSADFKSAAYADSATVPNGSGGGRTHTLFTAADFESAASASSATEPSTIYRFKEIGRWQKSRQSKQNEAASTLEYC